MAKEFKIKIDDTYMNVITFGRGSRNLVIIPGVSLCGLEGKGEALAEMYKIFEEEYTVYVLDRKKMIHPGTLVADMADDIYRIMKELEITKTDIYGVSQGGMIAQCIAIENPELVNKMVLCSTLCKATKSMKEVGDKWGELAEKEDVVALNRMFFDVVYSKEYMSQFEDILPTLESMGTPEDCRKFVILAQACTEFDISDSVSKISCPVLVIGDKDDQVTGLDGTMELAGKLGCEPYLYSGHGHAVYDEAKDIIKRIYEFLI